MSSWSSAPLEGRTVGRWRRRWCVAGADVAALVAGGGVIGRALGPALPGGRLACALLRCLLPCCRHCRRHLVVFLGPSRHEVDLPGAADERHTDMVRRGDASQDVALDVLPGA